MRAFVARAFVVMFAFFVLFAPDTCVRLLCSCVCCDACVYCVECVCCDVCVCCVRAFVVLMCLLCSCALRSLNVSAV